MNRTLPWRLFVRGVGILLMLVILLPACSDDPILGPNDGEDSGGGSYSNIQRLSPSSPPADSTAGGNPSSPGLPNGNPERF